MEEVERWLPVLGSPGYEISDHGGARSIDRWIIYKTGARRFYKGQVLKCTIAGQTKRVKRGRRPNKGYRYVNLGKGKRYERVCVLVLENFVGPRPAGTEACHGDGDNWNDRLDNLRWDTPSANSFDALRHGTHVVQVRSTSASGRDRR